MGVEEVPVPAVEVAEIREELVDERIEIVDEIEPNSSEEIEELFLFGSCSYKYSFGVLFLLWGKMWKKYELLWFLIFKLFFNLIQNFLLQVSDYAMSFILLYIGKR